MGRKKKEDQVLESTNVETNEEVKYTEITPSQYFDIVKGLKQECNSEQLLPVIEMCEKELKKFKILKQTEAARITTNYITMLNKEIKILEAGFKTYVLKEDIEKYIQHLSDNCVFCCEIADYPRSIDEDVFNKIADHIDIFDHIYILFTDYTQKVSNHIDKKTREKDPIMFGAINLDDQSRSFPVVGPRFYYIGDWVDDFCDLTLDKVIESFQKKENRTDVKKEITIPTTQKELNKEATLFNIEEKKSEKIDFISSAEQISQMSGGAN